jgi:hypothetical protein
MTRRGFRKTSRQRVPFAASKEAARYSGESKKR